MTWWPLISFCLYTMGVAITIDWLNGMLEDINKGSQPSRVADFIVVGCFSLLWPVFWVGLIVGTWLQSQGRRK